MDCKAGTILDSYQLKTLCGHGTYGSVFLAENRLTHETVAIKVISKAPSALTRELNGLVNYQSVRSPNLLPIRHIGQLDELVFYTMDPADDLGEGTDTYLPATLAEILRQQGPLPPTQLRTMLEQLLNGLQALHEHGLVHRDVKPDNILRVRGQFVLGDIGLVTSSQEASLRGTPLFMSPALLTGQRSALPQDDFYALGKVIYCALTGLPVERYPHLPPELPLADYAPFSQAMSVPCRDISPIHTADDFRALLQSGNAQTTASPARRRPSSRLLLLASILLLLSVGLSFVVHILGRNEAPLGLPPMMSSPETTTPLHAPSITPSTPTRPPNTAQKPKADSPKTSPETPSQPVTPAKPMAITPRTTPPSSPRRRPVHTPAAQFQRHTRRPRGNAVNHINTRRPVSTPQPKTPRQQNTDDYIRNFKTGQSVDIPQPLTPQQRKTQEYIRNFKTGQSVDIPQPLTPQQRKTQEYIRNFKTGQAVDIPQPLTPQQRKTQEYIRNFKTGQAVDIPQPLTPQQRKTQEYIRNFKTGVSH